MSDFSQLFKDIFLKNGLEEYICFEPEFKSLYEMLISVNSEMNLTALTSQSDIILKHFADSIRIERFIPKGASVVDVGCGGGFPSLPLCIVRKDISVVSVDSVAKKLGFIESVGKSLRLSVSTVCSRAEILGQTEYRDFFDVCVSRAVARLSVLTELCAPLVKTGGRFIAMKGAEADAELKEAEKILGMLNTVLLSDNSSILSDGSVRHDFVFEKKSATPSGFPRSYKKIKKGLV